MGLLDKGSELLDKFNDYKNTILGQKYIDKAYDAYGGFENGGSFMKSDAMRHLLWTAEMSRKFNPAVAKGISDWHENVVTPWGIFGGARPNQPENQRQMDLYNNALGIKIGQTSNSYEDTARLARELIDDGKAYIINEPIQNHPTLLGMPSDKLLGMGGGMAAPPANKTFTFDENKTTPINPLEGKPLSDIEVRLLQKKGLL
jgi:hypothetical protein